MTRFSFVNSSDNNNNKNHKNYQKNHRIKSKKSKKSKKGHSTRLLKEPLLRDNVSLEVSLDNNPNNGYNNDQIDNINNNHTSPNIHETEMTHSNLNVANLTKHNNKEEERGTPETGIGTRGHHHTPETPETGPLNVQRAITASTNTTFRGNASSFVSNVTHDSDLLQRQASDNISDFGNLSMANYQSNKSSEDGFIATNNSNNNNNNNKGGFDKILHMSAVGTVGGVAGLGGPGALHAIKTIPESQSNSAEVSRQSNSGHMDAPHRLHQSLDLTVSRDTSQWRTESIFNIENGLVVILGIGKYDYREGLVGVSKDYKNILYTFYQSFGYSVVLMDDSNNLHYCNPQPQSMKETKLPKKLQYKERWVTDEINEFIGNVVNILNSKKNKHDSVLFFISSHGDQDGVILDSEDEEVSLLGMFNSFFGDNCPQMLDKPKIFFIDACRGSMTSRIELKENQTVRGKNDGNNANNSNTTNNKHDKTQQTKQATFSNDIENKYDESEVSSNQNSDNIDSTGNSVNNINNNNNNNGLQSQARRKQSKLHGIFTMYHTQANCRFIYANPDGYAAIDGGKNGGYLMQAVKHVFCKFPEILSQNLDSIVNQIRTETRELVGTGAAENVEDVNHMNFNVYFKTRSHIMS